MWLWGSGSFLREALVWYISVSRTRCYEGELEASPTPLWIHIMFESCACHGMATTWISRTHHPLCHPRRRRTHDVVFSWIVRMGTNDASIHLASANVRSIFLLTQDSYTSRSWQPKLDGERNQPHPTTKNTTTTKTIHTHISGKYVCRLLLLFVLSRFRFFSGWSASKIHVMRAAWWAVLGEALRRRILRWNKILCTGYVWCSAAAMHI